jgi:hypothetical protein
MKKALPAIVLALVVGGIVILRQKAMSPTAGPAVPTTTTSAIQQEDAIPEMPTQAGKPTASAIPRLPVAPGSESVENTAAAPSEAIPPQMPQFREEPPGSSPDPLQEAQGKEKGADWGDSNAPPSGGTGEYLGNNPEEKQGQGLTKVVVPGMAGKPNARKVRAYRKKVVGDLQARVNAILAPVENEANKSACSKETDYADIPTLIDGTSTEGDKVLREWWDASSVDMLCSDNFAHCAKSATEDLGRSHCVQAALRSYIRSSLAGRDAPAVCGLIYGHGNANAPALANAGAACSQLAAAMATGNTKICSGFAEKLFDKGEAGDCKISFRFTQGKAACASLPHDGELNTPREQCLGLARTYAAVKKKSAAACGTDKRCLAAAKSPSTCGRKATAARQNSIKRKYCALYATSTGSNMKMREQAKKAEKQLNELRATLKPLPRDKPGDGLNTAAFSHFTVLDKARERLNALVGTPPSGLSENQ